MNKRNLILSMIATAIASSAICGAFLFIKAHPKLTKEQSAVQECIRLGTERFADPAGVQPDLEHSKAVPDELIDKNAWFVTVFITSINKYNARVGGAITCALIDQPDGSGWKEKLIQIY